MIAGENRMRNSVIAGLAALAGVSAVSFLSLVRNPLRRKREWEAVLEPEAAAGR